jgi:hypothetical protein
MSKSIERPITNEKHAIYTMRGRDSEAEAGVNTNVNFPSLTLKKSPVPPN